MATKKATAKFGASVKVQRGYPGKIRSSKDQGYTPVGEREPDRTKFKKGGSTSFGMLSVKAGVDKNPKPTAADRIAGAKMKKK